MIDNPTLAAMRERRSAHRFTTEPIGPEQLDAILEAGRWAPSATNSQPWDFVVVGDPALRARIGAILREVTWAWAGFAAAPAMIVVSVDPGRDPAHFVEAGAVAAQNLCLAAHSVGLASSWAGVYNGAGKSPAERDIKKLLSLPRTHRVIAVVPVGTPAHAARGSRRPLAGMVHRDGYRAAPGLDSPAPTAPSDLRDALVGRSSG
jgi:nitroreductase